jgi:archaellin
MIIVVSQPGTSTVTELFYTAATTPTATSFAVLNASESGSTLGNLSGQAKAVVLVKISPELQKSSVINLQINPPVGASLPMSRTAPSTIASSQILY